MFWTLFSNHPRDAEPLAYDVVSMGHPNTIQVVFVHIFYFYYLTHREQYPTPTVPLFAPLLDQMTPRPVTHRFCRFSGSCFCGFSKQSLRVEELDKSLPPEPSGCDPRAIDPWQDVLADFVTIWSSYQEFWL
jgi:hypothetical protein